MASSTIATFKAALTTRLQAESGLDGVQVTYGLPAPAGPGLEWVWVGNAYGFQVSRNQGQRAREESWAQEVQVSVLAAVREDQQTLTERAFEIAAVIEDSLREWSTPPDAFDAVVIWALVQELNLEEFISVDPETKSAKQREARVTIRVGCMNHI